MAVAGSARPRLGASLALAILALASFGCTLITDVDREKIPEAVTPAFPEVDAGQVPDATVPVPLGDAAVPLPVPDAAPPAEEPDASPPTDAAADAQ